MLQGKDLILAIDIPNGGTRAIAAAKSCDFELNTDFIGICAPHGSGGWKHNKPTTLSWSVSSSCLVADQADVETLMDLQIAKTPLLLRLYDTELKTYRKGYAYIASIKESGSKGDLVSLSISFTPAGALEKATSESDYPILVGDTLYTKWQFNEQTGNFTQTGVELDTNGNLVKHE